MAKTESNNELDIYSQALSNFINKKNKKRKKQKERPLEMWAAIIHLV